MRTVPPKYLYKIISQEAWEESLETRRLKFSSMDEQFIHLATIQQIPHVIQKFWADADYVILKIVSRKMIGELRYECNPVGSTKYYHLYDGHIPFDSIEEVEKNI